MGLRVLITNLALWPPSGTVIYVRDLALELQRQGHTPIVFSSTRGTVVRELRAAGIQVVDSPGRIRMKPDVIHGHHHDPTIVALRRWPTAPAIYVCHDHTSAYDRTPIHPAIRRYFGVSRLCVERLLRDGAPAGITGLQLNFVDTARYSPRAALPERPRRALLFSNAASEGGYLPAVAEACREAGLDLDVVGAGVNRIVTNPEHLLGTYDIVFGKGKAAMEAMAVGNAVILCDYGSVGPLVTSADFDRLRPLNFGREALPEPLRPELLLREIDRYDADDAGRVRDLIRSTAGLATAVERQVRIYREVAAEGWVGQSSVRATRWSFRELLFLRIYWAWASLSRSRRDRVRSLPGVSRGMSAARWFLRDRGL